MNVVWSAAPVFLDGQYSSFLATTHFIIGSRPWKAEPSQAGRPIRFNFKVYFDFMMPRKRKAGTKTNTKSLRGALC
jgi:hypothetical protein